MTRFVDEQNRQMQLLGSMVDLTGQRVLDVGCGEGQLTLLMAELASSVVGIDPDAEAIDTARRATNATVRDRISFIVEDVNAVSAPWSSAFDVVLFSRSL